MEPALFLGGLTIPIFAEIGDSLHQSLLAVKAFKSAEEAKARSAVLHDFFVVVRGWSASSPSLDSSLTERVLQHCFCNTLYK
jgi:hypothetical protein